MVSRSIKTKAKEFFVKSVSPNATPLVHRTRACKQASPTALRKNQIHNLLPFPATYVENERNNGVHPHRVRQYSVQYVQVIVGVVHGRLLGQSEGGYIRIGSM